MSRTAILCSVLVIVAVSGCDRHDPAPTPDLEEVRGAPIASAPATEQRPPARPAARAEVSEPPVAEKKPKKKLKKKLKKLEKKPKHARPTSSGRKPLRLPADARALVTIGFKELASFSFDPQPKAIDTAKIPADIKALDGRRIAITGFMIVTAMGDVHVQEFILSRHQFGCCFGKEPEINELILVRVPKGLALEAPDTATVQLTGRIKVSAQRDESGWANYLYTVVAEQVVPVH